VGRWGVAGLGAGDRVPQPHVPSPVGGGHAGFVRENATEETPAWGREGVAGLVRVIGSHTTPSLRRRRGQQVSVRGERHEETPPVWPVRGRPVWVRVIGSHNHTVPSPIGGGQQVPVRGEHHEEAPLVWMQGTWRLYVLGVNPSRKGLRNVGGSHSRFPNYEVLRGCSVAVSCSAADAAVAAGGRRRVGRSV